LELVTLIWNHLLLSSSCTCFNSKALWYIKFIN